MKASRLLLIAGCVVAAGIFIACGGDDTTSPPPAAGVEFKDLQAEDDVLFNLALAYNKRSTVELDKLLDEDFILLFSTEDVIQKGTSSRTRCSSCGASSKPSGLPPAALTTPRPSSSSKSG